MFLPRLLVIALLSPIILSGQTVTVERDQHPVRPSTRLQLVAQVDPASSKAGSQVFIRLSLKNISDHVARLQDSAPDTDYAIIVADTFGKEPPRTEWGKKLLSGELALLRNTTMDLEPGQEVAVTVEITRVYQLTLAGAYYARVTRGGVWAETEEDQKKFIEQAFSNPVRFTILP
jgi:hypothetical protein